MREGKGMGNVATKTGRKKEITESAMKARQRGSRKKIRRGGKKTP